MSQFLHTHRTSLIAVLTVALAGGLAAAVPTITYAAGPVAQTAPIEGSIFPALLQVALIVLVTEGIKSLARALGGTNEDGSPKIDLKGREAALAYIVVGIAVYVIQSFLLPALPEAAQAALTNILAVMATLLAGSGLFSMTSAFRVK